MEIMLEQERFEMALKAVQLRAERHVKEFQPAYAKLLVEDVPLFQLQSCLQCLAFICLMH